MTAGANPARDDQRILHNYIVASYKHSVTMKKSIAPNDQIRREELDRQAQDESIFQPLKDEVCLNSLLLFY